MAIPENNVEDNYDHKEKLPRPIPRKRRWGSSKANRPEAKPILTISTDSLKVKPAIHVLLRYEPTVTVTGCCRELIELSTDFPQFKPLVSIFSQAEAWLVCYLPSLPRLLEKYLTMSQGAVVLGCRSHPPKQIIC